MLSSASVGLYYLVGMAVTYRVTAMFVYEVGPWNVFGRLRAWVGVYYDDYSNRKARSQFAALFNCHKCLSVWVGWGFAALIHPPGWTLVDIFLDGLLFSAATVVIQSVVGFLESRTP